MQLDHVQYEVDDLVGVITLNRPEAANAQDVQGHSTAIDACFDMHHFGHTRARVVTGGMPALAGLSSMKDKGKGE